MFFIGFPLNAMLRFESVKEVAERIGNEGELLYRINTLKDNFQTFVGAGDYLVMFFVLMTALLGAWCGLCWLHSRKKMDLMGSLPMRREKLFLAESISILLLFVVPYVVNLILALLAGASKGIFTGKALMMSMVGLGIHLVYFVALYLCGAVAMLLTGKILTGILGTMVLLGIAPAMYAVTGAYASMFLVTYVSNDRMLVKIIEYLSPAGSLVSVTNRMNIWQGVRDGKIIVWVPLLTAVFMAVVLAGLCIWLMKIRRTEGAEQSIAFPKTEGIIKAIILYPLGLGGGLFFMALGYVGADEERFWLWFGIVFALVLGSILIEVIYHLDRKRIFEHKMWTGIAVGLVILTASGFVYDAVGFDRWLPDREDVEYAVSYTNIFWGRYPDGSRDSEEYMEKHMEEFSVDEVYELAKVGVAHLDDEDLYAREDMTRVTINFQMKNGKMKKRCYTVPYAEVMKVEEAMYQVDAYKDCMLPILWTESSEIDTVELNLNDRQFYFENLNNEEKQELVQIYQEELRNLEYEKVFDVNSGIFYFFDQEKNEVSNGVRYPLNENFKQTVGFLKGKGMEPEFVIKAEDVRSLTFNDYRKGQSEAADVEVEAEGAKAEMAAEDKVMDDPEEILQAMEGLVNTVGRRWYMNGRKEFCNDLDVVVEYVAENGDVITTYGVYRVGEIPQCVEEFLKK